VSNDRSVAIAIEMGIRRVTPDGWFWMFVGGSHRRLIAVVDDATALPKPPDLELRAPGLWTELRAQVDFDHFTFDLEAFGVELDEPADLLGAAYGRRVALGGELEWDTAGDVRFGDSGYELPCTVHGELLIDDLTIELDGRGWRAHWWGPQRLNAGFSGFADDTPMRDHGDDAPARLLSVPTPAGVDHELVLGTAQVGWIRRPGTAR